MLKFQSALQGITWPALPSTAGASLLALLYQLGESQWQTPDEIRAAQFEQLTILLDYLHRHSAHFQQLLESAGWTPGKIVDEATWRRLPVLTRSTFQSTREQLSAHVPLKDHGRTMEFATNGSLGMPVRGLGNELTHLFMSSLVIRNHLWHRRDLANKFAAIRPMVETARLPSWGIIESAIFATGPAVVLDIANDVDRQLDWLIAEQPGYLLTHPSNLRELLLRARERDIRISSFVELSTFGEMLPADLRALAHEIWGLPIVDAYSSEEFGNIALQCPEVREHYHVQAENLLVEVVDDQGQPCAPGEVGRVLVSTLHNFTMPLLRYEIGDYAALGPPCPCGRGLPVIRQIAGRKRNMLRRRDGRQHWPSFPYPDLCDIADYRQIQIVQTDFEELEVRLVLKQPLDRDGQAAFGARLDRLLHGRFRYRFVFPDTLRPSARGKFEDFLCQVPDHSTGANT